MKYIILLIAFGIASCTPKISPDGCSTEGTMRDMTGLDGCKFLIELDDGKRLNPVEYSVKASDFEDGQRIRFAYEVVEVMNVCMSGQTVKVTCLEIP
jgi:hypothetical protein